MSGILPFILIVTGALSWSNIDTNVSVGTIFSILPAAGGVLQPGRNQLAAGFFVYGPQTTLLVSFGKAVAAFQLGDDGVFHDMGWAVTIPSDTREFAINASNMRHWQPDVAGYIADCLGGEAGPRKVNFNMRWIGSLVADAWRIFRRGGIFLYPSDARPGYEAGRLRLVYEANPVAFLVYPLHNCVARYSRRHQQVDLLFAIQRCHTLFLYNYLPHLAL